MPPQVLAWSAFEASIFLSWVGVLMGFNQGFLLRAVVPNVVSVSGEFREVAAAWGHR